MQTHKTLAEFKRLSQAAAQMIVLVAIKSLAYKSNFYLANGKKIRN